MLKGKYAWIAEAFGGLLLFLLPLKFGTLVAVPNLTMIYWSDPVSLLVGIWPFPVFPVVACTLIAYAFWKMKNRKSLQALCTLALVSCFCYNKSNLINTRALTP